MGPLAYWKNEERGVAIDKFTNTHLTSLRHLAALLGPRREEEQTECACATTQGECTASGRFVVPENTTPRGQKREERRTNMCWSC